MENTKFIDKAIEIIQALKEEKVIEITDNLEEWRPSKDYPEILGYLANRPNWVRIAKEPTYRPYANAEEFLKASKEHGGWISNGKRCVQYQFNPIATYSGIVYWYNPVDKSNESISYEGLLEYNFIWTLDSTPCGVLEE